MGVGAIEEFAKFFPFSRYLLSKGYMTSVTDTVTYFAIIGLVFGIVEDVLYTLQGPGGTAFLRLAVGLFFHAALTSIVGFYFARSYFLRSQQRQTLVAYLSVAAIHGIYDYSAAINNGLFVVAWATAVFVNCYMFWLYYKAVLFDFQFRSGMLRMGGVPGPAYAPAPTPSYAYAGVNQYQQSAPWQPPQPPIPQPPVQSMASYQPPQPVHWQQPVAPSQPPQQYRPPVSPFTPQ